MPFNVCYNNQKYYLENNSNDKQYKKECLSVQTQYNTFLRFET